MSVTPYVGGGGTVDQQAAKTSFCNFVPQATWELDFSLKCATNMRQERIESHLIEFLAKF